MGRHPSRIAGADPVHGHQQLRILRSDHTENVRSDAGGRVRRGDEAVLEDSSGTAGEPTGDVSAGRLQLSPSNALEISGLAARLQWRPVAAAHDAPGGSASAAAA